MINRRTIVVSFTILIYILLNPASVMTGFTLISTPKHGKESRLA